MLPRLWILALLAALGASACASAPARPRRRVRLYPGNTTATPGVDVLPALGRRRAHLSRRMRFAWMLAEESLSVPLPPPPAARDAATVQVWADTTLRDWLRRKSHAVESARRVLDEAAEQSHAQRVLAGALVGLLYEDVAQVFSHVPLPAELRTEPEIAAAFRDVIEFQASPYIEHARRAYGACAANGIRPRSMRRWARFCAARGERLPEPRRLVARQGTTVTVSFDPNYADDADDDEYDEDDE